MIDILIFNRTIDNNYINISNMESFFDYYDVIISVGAWSDFVALLIQLIME